MRKKNIFLHWLRLLIQICYLNFLSSSYLPWKKTNMIAVLLPFWKRIYSNKRPSQHPLHFFLAEKVAKFHQNWLYSQENIIFFFRILSPECQFRTCAEIVENYFNHWINVTCKKCKKWPRFTEIGTKKIKLAKVVAKEKKILAQTLN